MSSIDKQNEQRNNYQYSQLSHINISFKSFNVRTQAPKGVIKGEGNEGNRSPPGNPIWFYNLTIKTNNKYS